MVKLLRAFMEENSSEKCAQLMEDYAMNGGDGGATRAALREACNLLPPVPSQNDPSSGDLDKPQEALPDAPPVEKQFPLLPQATAVMKYMLDMCIDRITASEVHKIQTLYYVMNPTQFLDLSLIHI